MNALNLARQSSADYVWTFPGSPIRIYLSLEVVSILREQLLTGSDPSSAKEIGGLLLGKAHAGGVHITSIRSFVPSGTSHKFILSDSDKKTLRELIGKQKGSDGFRSVVGYFRSDQRGGIRMSEEDLLLSKELFPNPEQVFLVISKPDKNTPKAGFFFWDSGAIFTEASFLQFELDEKLLALPRTSAVPQTVAPVSSEDDAGASNKAKAASLIRSSWVTGLLFLAVVAVAAVYYIRNSSSSQNGVPARPESSSSLSLSATYTNNNVTVLWNSKLPVIADARIGVLTVRDGASQTEIPLTRAQLQIGKLIYVTQTDRIEVALEIFSQNGYASRESLLMALAKAQSEVPTINTSLAKSETVRGSVVATEPLTDKTPAYFSAAATSNIVNKAPNAHSLSVGVTGADRQTLHPPVAVRQITPIIADEVRSALRTPVEMQVRVTIDQTGKVVKAELVGATEGMNQSLVTSAVNAARAWTFQPARRGAIPVASEFVLKFAVGAAAVDKPD